MITGFGQPVTVKNNLGPECAGSFHLHIGGISRHDHSGRDTEPLGMICNRLGMITGQISGGVGHESPQVKAGDLLYRRLVQVCRARHVPVVECQAYPARLQLPISLRLRETLIVPRGLVVADLGAPTGGDLGIKSPKRGIQ